MYVPEAEFVNVLSKNEGLLKQWVQRIQFSSKYRNCSFEDLYAMIQFAAWKAWLTQLKQAAKPENNGQSPYTFGTYMTRQVKLALNREYSELALDSILSDGSELLVADNPRNEIYLMEVQELVHDLLQDLPDKQKQVLTMRFFQDKTLRECGEVLNLTTERIRQIEQEALKNLRTELCKM
jgi:RNA polymerase sigma factor (sigma-70 family)